MRSPSGLIARHNTAYISLGLFSPPAAGPLYHYASTPLSSKLLPIYLVQENEAVVCQQLSLQPTKEVGPRWNGTTLCPPVKTEAEFTTNGNFDERGVIIYQTSTVPIPQVPALDGALCLFSLCFLSVFIIN